MKDNFGTKNNCEGIYVCTRGLSKDSLKEDELAILSDFKKLDFGTNPCTDSSDINYNDGKEANPFDKIAKHYGRGRNVFLFISLLKNEDFSKKIEEIIKEKCGETQQAKFIERATLYLTRVKQGEMTAKEFLNDESFSGAFFNGYHCGEMKNIHANLNINFTQPSQFLDTHDIFDRKIVTTEAGMLQRVKVYDNGRRAATIEIDKKDRKYKFAKDSSCQLVIKNAKGTVFLDIVAGKVAYVEQEINSVRTNPRKASEVIEEVINDNEIHINQNCLKEALHTYFNEEENIPQSCVIQEQCLPIMTLEDLNNWKPSEHNHSTEHLYRRAKDDGPKTLVCHDMKGGYLEDRFINGTKGEDNYFFLHWPSIDIFVYFSHNLVTIPPCSWISAAHKNGVQILGTFITEWDDGAKVCDEFLKDEKSAYNLSMQLVNIAMHCNFDGWLINIENRLKPHQIPLLKKFVSVMTLKMHLFRPRSQVIWYDSVIKNGELKWQNALNDQNRMFFTACDGIFLNYNWKEEDLTQSVKAAGPRQTDVYVGVDVFGRGCLGGGGFSTNVAVAEARKFGLSVAIFAPGWVHECLDLKDFKENQFKFWAALQKYCPARELKELPFYSSFCPGFGKKLFRNGKIVDNEPWYNLGLQSLQPIYSSREKSSVELYSEDAYNGGGCIRLSGVTGDSREANCGGQCLNIKILKTEFKIESELVISYTYKPILPSTDIVLVLRLHSYVQLWLVGNDCTPLEKDCNTTILFSPASKDEVLKRGYKLKERIPEEDTWITRTYFLTSADYHMYSVSVKLTSIESSPTPVSALLGELEIISLQPRYKFRYRDLLCEFDTTNEQVKVQCVLEWRYEDSVSCSDLYLEMGEERKYLCTTSQLIYKLEHIFSCKNFFAVILCPKSARNENLAEETLYVSFV